MAITAALRLAAGLVFVADQASPEYETACSKLYQYMSSAQRNQLFQLVIQGPVWDGDVISKDARDDLLELHLASRACVKGEQGYTVANYRGWDVDKTSKNG